MDEQEISFGGVAEPMVAAEPRISDLPKSTRGFRSGPVAAVVATVAIVAATAIPSRASFKTPPTSPAPVASSYGVDRVPLLEGLGALRLGGSLGGFTLLGSDCSWDDRSDGTSTFRVRLASDEDPDTFLFGDLFLRGRSSSRSMEAVSRELFTGIVPKVEGAGPRLGPAPALPGVDVYTSLAGTLMGAGELEGASIAIRNVPGTSVRRGPWSGGEIRHTAPLEDTVFARIVWMRESKSPRRSIEPQGGGSLSLYLEPGTTPE